MDNRMMKILICVSLTLISCSIMLDKQVRLDNSDENYRALKDYAICYCIYEVNNIPDEIRVKDGSLGAYVQNSNVPVESFDTMQYFVNNYIDTLQLKSSVGATLGVKRCIVMYNSKELEKRLISITK